MSGDHRRSAELFADLAAREPNDTAIARRAVAEAISAGEMKLALQLSRKLPANALAIDSRMLLVADALRRERSNEAIAMLSAGRTDADLDFIAPLIRAWASAERRDAGGATAALASIPANSLIGPFLAEQRAFILTRLGRTPEAEALAGQVLANAGPRAQRLRLLFADGFLKAGDQARARAMAAELGGDYLTARRKIESGKRVGVSVDTSAEAFSELLTGIAADINRLNNRALPVALTQIALHAAPDNSAAALLLGAMLEARGNLPAALAAFRRIRPGDPFEPQARDLEARALAEAKRFDEALAVARREAQANTADAGDFARLGDVLNEMKRHHEAADAYERALAMSGGSPAQERWPLLLLRAAALEEANRWAEAKSALQAALSLAPDQPLILNFLGYAMLERGENLDIAEAMIRKASALAPDDASITDSLGWALYKRGRLEEAIDVLQRAAAKDPGQAEIREHLGDALFKAGRRYEARFAWQAALVTAEDDIAQRVRAKLDWGLTSATAAP